MKTLHVNAGNENGGGRTIIINILRGLNQQDIDSQLLVFERGPVSDLANEWQIPTTIMNQDGQFDLRVLGRLKKFINDNQIDIVNTHGPRANFLMSLIYKHVHAKWIITVHSDPYVDFSDNLKGKLMTNLNLRALKKAELLMPVTAKFKPILEQVGIAADKIKPVFNTMYFREKAPQTTRQDPFTLLNVARLVPVKNQQLLLKVLAELDFDYRLKLVGDGTARPQLEHLVQELNLEQKVEFVGFQDKTEQYYQNADLFVLPSLSEGFPLVLLEAANNALPVVASDAGSDAQAVQPGMGWITPINDFESLKQALIQAHDLWQKDELRALGQKYYEYCAANFSNERLAQTISEIYQTMLK